jgi:glycosyltransferase involved in cell wall biosynthesis
MAAAERPPIGQADRPARIVIDATIICERGKGFSRYGVSLLWQLADLDDRSEYLVLLDDRGDLPALPEAANFSYLRVRARPSMLWRLVGLPLLLRRRSYDLIHILGEISPLRIFRSGPQVLTATELPGIRHALHPATTLREWLSHRLYSMLFPRSLRTADLVLSISESTRGDLLRDLDLDANRIKTVPLAASGDFARFQSAEELDAFRERIGCPEGYVVAFATADSRENVELLCEAWGKVVQTGKIAESLLFAGGHSDAVRTRLLGRASILGIGDRVKFCGYVEELDLPTLYSASTCYVDCSRYEGFGLQSLEAMVAGTAVVASDIPATQEVVSDAALLY